MERKELELGGDAIKVFLLVFIYLSKEWKIWSVTYCTLEGTKKVIEGEFCTGSALVVIGSDHMIKNVGGFNGGRKSCINDGVEI